MKNLNGKQCSNSGSLSCEVNQELKLLTQLLTETTTHKFPSLGEGGDDEAAEEADEDADEERLRLVADALPGQGRVLHHPTENTCKKQNNNYLKLLYREFQGNLTLQRVPEFV